MQLSKTQKEDLAKIAIEAVKDCQEILKQYKDVPLKKQHKDKGHSRASSVVTEVDFLCQKKILSHLKPTLSTFDLGLLTEEAEDDKSRLIKDYFWCIDPLDGTLPFTEGASGYAVSIALIARNGISHIGVVLDPGKEALYHAILDGGAFCNQKPLLRGKKEKPKHLSLMVDRSLVERDFYHQVIGKILDISQKLDYKAPMKITQHGAAVMNALWALEEGGLYFKLPKKEEGGGSFWDFAATCCLYKECGLFVTDFFGAPLLFNQKETTFMNQKGVLYAADKKLAEALLQENWHEFIPKS